VTLAAGQGGAAVQFYQALHDGQADAQPALRLLQRPIDLRKHVEHPGQHLRRDADAGVLDADDRLVALTLDRQPDAAAPLAVLDGVVEQVAQRLGQPGPVRVHVHRLVRQRHRQLLPLLPGQRLTRFQGTAHHGGQADPLLADGDLAPADAADVEQVVHEPAEVVQLPLHHDARLVDRLAVAARQPHDLQAVAQRRQRVAQLVGEHGEELGLAAVLLPQRRLGLFALDDVAGDLRRPDNLAGGALDRRDGQRHVHPATVLAQPLRLEILDRLAPPDPSHDRRQFVGVVGRDEQGQRLADDLPGGVAVQPLGPVRRRRSR
jgi:hypothetical protein